MAAHSRFEQSRIQQLTGTYAPDAPPRLPLDFGDYLSLLWRIDRAAEQANKVRYYRQCVAALAAALALPAALLRLVDHAPPGEIYRSLPNLPFREATKTHDVNDRRAAIAQLIMLRADTLAIGTYQENWVGVGSFPGSGILDTELRERVFAVLFTALQGQFANFGRLLLVLDIVLGDFLAPKCGETEVELNELIVHFGYPNPDDAKVKRDFNTVSRP